LTLRGMCISVAIHTSTRHRRIREDALMNPNAGRLTEQGIER
jgi:hypothetical protein